MELKQAYMGLLQSIPGITEPLQKSTFRSKLKWTGLILVLYFMLAQITAFGIAQTNLAQFRTLEILLGSSFGSLMTLGIGPIVTASIILQLMVGSKIIPWDLKSESGKVLFQGTQKLLAVLFAFAEAGIYVMFGAVAAQPGLEVVVILQLAMGGVLVIFMDEVISKWGFGSGISLFILAGVSKTIVVRTFNPLTQAGGFPTAGNPPAGIIPYAISSVGAGDVILAAISLLPILATALVFLLVVYANNIRVEIPLAFGSVRGFGRRWPLKFFYTSNIPVILMAALLANVQLLGRMIAQGGGQDWIAQLDSQGNIIGGLLLFVAPPQGEPLAILMITIGVFALLGAVATYYTKREGIKLVAAFGFVGFLAWAGAGILSGSSLFQVQPIDLIRAFTYSFFLIGGATLFAMFWVNTAGMDAKSVAGQIQSTGLQIPGYRRDIRIIERVLSRYITPLTVLGGASVGFLAAFADFTNALGTGTGLLLATLIVMNLYEELAMRHMEDMHPAMRRFFSK